MSSCGSLHYGGHCCGIGVVPCSRILEIHHQHIDLLEHLRRRWMEPHAVMQQVHGCASCGIDLLSAAGSDIHIDSAGETMLGRENCGHPETRADQPVKITTALS